MGLGIDSLDGAALQRAHLADEAVARKIVINRERVKLLKTVDDFEKQLEIEKVERLERVRPAVRRGRLPHRVLPDHVVRAAAAAGGGGGGAFRRKKPDVEYAP